MAIRAWQVILVVISVVVFAIAFFIMLTPPEEPEPDETVTIQGIFNEYSETTSSYKSKHIFLLDIDNESFCVVIEKTEFNQLKEYVGSDVLIKGYWINLGLCPKNRGIMVESYTKL